MTTEEGNKLIADFVQYESDWPYDSNAWYNSLKFHTSWDWLMPVVEKINRLGCMVTINLWTETTPPSTEVKIYDWGGMNTIEAELSTPIKSVYDAVTQFIQWHNQKP